MFQTIRTLFLIVLAFPAAAQNVRVSWIGQACFYIQTEGGSTVVVDPPAANVGYALPSTPADVVTVSHNHTDHNNSAGVRGTPTLVDGRPTTARTEMTAAGMPFVLVPGFHDNTNGSTRGQNTIVRWIQSGMRFAHFGDYGQSSLTDAQLADLRDLDVIMVPAGGFFTIEGAETAQLINQLRPKIAILMHFRTAIGGPAQLSGPPAVANAFPNIRYMPSNVTVSRTTLPASTEVWLMEPVADTSVVNAASFIPGAPVSRSALATAFGTFTGSATQAFSSFPLPRRLGETEIVIGNEAVPLTYASPTQINFQIPARLTPGQNVYEVRVAGQRVGRGTITTVDRSPGVFVAVDADGRLNRVRRGGSLTIYATGAGETSPAVADGATAPGSPPARTTAEPAVFFNGRRAVVAFTGLAPGFAGLWQINVQVPSETPVGNDVVVQVLFEQNLVSNSLKIAVE
jgi:uncharacterized protein (TIGR03437 family)